MISVTFVASLTITSCLFLSVLCDVPVPKILSYEVKTEIEYTLAKTSISSLVQNIADVFQEVFFSLVIPEDAFITSFYIELEGQIYKSYVKDKEEAQKEFEEAVKGNQTAGLVSDTDVRYSKNFTVSVNVEPRVHIRFYLTYIEVLSRIGNSYTLEVNINLPQIVTNLDINVKIKDVLNITSVKVLQFKTSNELNLTESENPNATKEFISLNEVLVKWCPTEEEQKQINPEGLSGQMIVKYDLDVSKNEQLVLVDHNRYFVHFLRFYNLRVLKKHVTYILDLSGSMYGNKIEQLKQAMLEILSKLTECDFFSIVLFSTTVLPWNTDGVDLEKLNSFEFFEGPIIVPVNESYIISASDENIEKALDFVKTIQTYGSTNINGSLRTGIDIVKLGEKMFHDCLNPFEEMIVFLTDGLPNVEESDPDKIVENVIIQNKGKKRCQHHKPSTIPERHIDSNKTYLNHTINSYPRAIIHSLGFGSDADMIFLKKLSLTNKGDAKRIYDASDAALQLQYFMNNINYPLLSDVHIMYTPGQTENVTLPETNTIYAGADMVATGRITLDGMISGWISAITTEGRKSFPIDVEPVILPCPENDIEQFGAIELIWAHKTFDYYADMYLVTGNKFYKYKAIHLALKYSFVTQWTSLIVVKPNENSTVVDDQPQSSNSVPGASGAAFLPRMPGFSGKVASSLAIGLPVASFPAEADEEELELPMEAPIPVPPPSPTPGPTGSFLTTPMPPVNPPSSNPPPTSTPEPPAIPPSSSPPPTSPPGPCTRVPYTNVSWLNQPACDDDQFLQPPPEVDENRVIALNETNVCTNTCSDGTQCRHFIFCVLQAFADNVQEYLKYKCNIGSQYLGVCCPRTNQC